MYLTSTQTFIIILSITLATMLTRFLPFVFFPDDKEVPSYVLYLGNILPYAMSGLLVVYCLKGVSFTNFPFALPEIISILLIIILHPWRKNSLLSIGAGTISYMLLIQFVFK
jgi:branched-subunit amino acid transport protein AzlD